MAGRRHHATVVFAASLGTVFEWYDFFVYGTLAVLFAEKFFPGEGATGFLLALATFGVGFLVRPLGGAVFGHLGDVLGRKYTFLVTISLMGTSTAAVGLLPTYADVGIIAPLLLVACRLIQGLALGGEYGGAAIYVAEHAPAGRRGFYTGFIQASATAGFLLSLAVVATLSTWLGPENWRDWGWRLPFLLSVFLLLLSLIIRVKLRESPAFQEMKDKGQVAKRPLSESFGHSGHRRAMLVVLFGIAAGLTVIWYTAQFHVLYFLQNTMRLEEESARLIVAAGTASGLVWPVLFGGVSDRVGRKPVIVTGYVLTLILIFPLFSWLGNAANGELMDAQRRAPLVVSGGDCQGGGAPSDRKGQCQLVLAELSKSGLVYTVAPSDPSTALNVRFGGVVISAENPNSLKKGLAASGYPIEKHEPNGSGVVQAILAITLLCALSGMTNGPAGALLVELFPARIRYTSVSIPYHVGSGYFGGFLPLISQSITIQTGNPLSGLWYLVGVVAVALVVTLLWLREPKSLASNPDTNMDQSP